MDWRHRAACLSEDPELFFPIGNTGPALAQIEEAKKVCARCEVRAECLAWALEAGQDHGVWGGMSEDERRAIKRRQSPLPRASFLTCSQFSARRWSQPLERDYEPGTGSDPVGVVLEGERATEVLHQGRHD